MDALNEAERALKEAVANGSALVMGHERPDTPEDDRTVRAEFLRFLVLRQEGTASSSPRSLRIAGFWVSGSFDVSGASVDALLAFECCTFDAPLRMDEARLGRNLVLSGSECPGFSARDLRAEGDVRLDDGFRATGMVDLEGAHIAGLLRLSRAELIRTQGVPYTEDGAARVNSLTVASRDTDDTVLNASRLHAGAVHAIELRATGIIWLISARVDGLCSMKGATLSNPGGTVLQGERLDIGESLWLHNGFQSDGRIQLLNANIRGSLDVCRATLSDSAVRPGPILNFRHGTTGRSAAFDRSTISGSVSLDHARVASEVRFSEAEFGAGDTFLSAQHMSAVTLVMTFQSGPQLCDLTNAKLDVIELDKPTWPKKMKLDGCSYRVLADKSSDLLEDRLAWLELDSSGYSPWKYDQLIAAYRSAGDEQSADTVALAKQRQRTRSPSMSLPGKFWGTIQFLTVGYGYRTWWALYWILALVAIGTGVFSYWPPQPKPEPAPFATFVYSVDLLIPIMDLGLRDGSTPLGWTAPVAWAMRALGWILSLSLATGVTRRLNRL